jgi:hypothetical protein
LRKRSDNEGLSTLLVTIPKTSSAEPCVFSCTPPGPNTFSAGPNLKLISAKLNLSSKLAWASAAISGLSLKLLKTSYISIGSGAIGTNRVTSYQFEVVAE